MKDIIQSKILQSFTLFTVSQYVIIFGSVPVYLCWFN